MPVDRSWIVALCVATTSLSAQEDGAASGSGKGASRDADAGADPAAVLARRGKRGARVHDPSSIVRSNDEYWLFATGVGIQSWRSKDLADWTRGPRVFQEMPDWVRSVVPEQRGHFWAPDVILLGGRYLLYYSVSKFGANTSAIALASSPALDPGDPAYGWTDHGIVIQSRAEDDFNAIDPAVIRTRDGELWMSFGSYWSGIKLLELDPETGKRIDPEAPLHSLARYRAIEAPHVFQHGEHYYLFVNWDRCCRGVESTYNIRIGRSREITGPYLDKDGVDLLAGGGTLFAASEGPFIGPGHANVLEEDGKLRFSCHYYDATERGRSFLAIAPLSWSEDGWPVLASAPPLAPAGAGEAKTAAAEPELELVLSEVSERTVRIVLAPLSGSGEPESARSPVLVPFPSAERLRTRDFAQAAGATAGSLRVEVASGPVVTVRRRDGSLVQELAFERDGGVAFRTKAPVLGLGEGAQQFDRRGALYPMEPSWGGWNRPVLGSVVPSPFVIGTDGWALFVHRPEGSFDLRDGKGRFLPRPEGSGAMPLDLFVVDVEEPAATLRELTRLTGRPAMPPRWALGYFQSHRTLAGPGEPLAIARTFREKELPCDTLIYLGTGYCPRGWNKGHGSIEFNPEAFPDPARNLRVLEELDFRVVLHVNRAPRNLFGASFAESSDSPSHIRNYWARHRETFALGIDGWWPDDGDELPLVARLARHRCYYVGALSERPGMRPWSLHRTGYAGAARYGGWIWSGDIDSTWATLAAQVSVGLNHSLSLTPFWGTDTGGFYPTEELTGELYTRWFQFSAFCPLFRSHGRTWKLRLPWGWNTGETGPVEHRRGPNPSELRNPEVEPICRKFLELRYRLLPYNYTLVREAHDTGLPPMRALWLHYPGDPEAVGLGDEYLWGRELLVAPVVTKGAASRRVYLPAGIWLDWWTGERVEGGRWIERPVDLGTLPLYARAGAIIPLDPPRQHTAQAVTEPATLRIHPGADGEFTVYDDDGESLGYQDGSDPSIVWIRMRWNDAARRLTLEPDPRMARWTRNTRSFRAELAGSDAPPVRIEFSGRKTEAVLGKPDSGRERRSL